MSKIDIPIAKPDIEIKRESSPGYYRSYAIIYFKPLSVWVMGHWLIGRKKVKEAWMNYESE